MPRVLCWAVGEAGDPHGGCDTAVLCSASGDRSSSLPCRQDVSRETRADSPAIASPDCHAATTRTPPSANERLRGLGWSAIALHCGGHHIQRTGAEPMTNAKHALPDQALVSSTDTPAHRADHRPANWTPRAPYLPLAATHAVASHSRSHRAIASVSRETCAAYVRTSSCRQPPRPQHARPAQHIGPAGYFRPLVTMQPYGHRV